MQGGHLHNLAWNAVGANAPKEVSGEDLVAVSASLVVPLSALDQDIETDADGVLGLKLLENGIELASPPVHAILGNNIIIIIILILIIIRLTIIMTKIISIKKQ